MPPLYLIQQGAKVRVQNRRLTVVREAGGDDPEETLVSLPLAHVDQVVIFGNIGLTTPAIDALLASQCEVIFLTQNGEYRGRLSGEITPHVPLRRAQYQRLASPAFTLKMACGFAAAKLNHQRVLLRRHNRELQDPLVEDAAAQLGEVIESLPRRARLSSLRGAEGAATAAYFGAFRRFFAPEWRFHDRSRRPPADPVNVLLSFGYTLMTQAAAGAVSAVGLDPCAGFLHEVVYNRPALALDLLEEFRPVVDGIVLWVCRSGQLSPADFSPGPPERPVLLSESGQRRFLQAYEQRMEQTFTHPRRGQKLTLRQCLLEQARQIAACILNDDPHYEGMDFR